MVCVMLNLVYKGFSDDAYILTKGCALPEGNHSCVSVSTKMCPESKLNMKRIKCVMGDNKNGCNKEEWQNDPFPTTTGEGILCDITQVLNFEDNMAIEVDDTNRNLNC
jgi:hypothetical protein